MISFLYLSDKEEEMERKLHLEHLSQGCTILSTHRAESPFRGVLCFITRNILTNCFECFTL